MKHKKPYREGGDSGHNLTEILSTYAQSVPLLESLSQYMRGPLFLVKTLLIYLIWNCLMHFLIKQKPIFLQNTRFLIFIKSTLTQLIILILILLKAGIQPASIGLLFLSLTNLLALGK